MADLNDQRDVEETDSKKDETSNTLDQGPIGIEIGSIANLIACGYSGTVKRTYVILDKKVDVTFEIGR